MLRLYINSGIRTSDVVADLRVCPRNADTGEYKIRPYATMGKEVQEKLLPGLDRGVPCFISLGEVKNTAPSKGGVGVGG